MKKSLIVIAAALTLLAAGCASEGGFVGTRSYMPQADQTPWPWQQEVPYQD